MAKATGVPNAGEASPPQSQTGGVAGSSTTGGRPGRRRRRSPPASRTPTTRLNYNDHPITVPATGDNASMSVRVSWPSLTGDWDVKLYEDTNGDGKSQNDEPVVSTSQTGPSNVEEVSADGTPRLPAGKKYVLRVNNFAATAPTTTTVDITFEPPLPFKAGAGGELHAHVRAGRARVRDPAGPDRPRPGQAARPERMRARHRRRRPGGDASGRDADPEHARLRLRRDPALGQGRARRARRALGVLQARLAAVNVDVFQVAAGRKVIGERLVARFRGKSRSFTWNGKSKRKRVRPGYFFARYSIKLPNGTSDVRRKVFRLKGGRFTARPDFYRRESCGLLRSYKLERAAFGGSTKRPLRAAFRLTRASTVRIQVLRGDEGRQDAREVEAASRPTARTARRLTAKGLRKGDYKVRITVRRAGSQDRDLDADHAQAVAGTRLVQDGGEPALERAGEHLAHGAFLEALDQLGHEALDHEALRLRLGQPARAQVEELLLVDLRDRRRVGAADVVGEDLEARDRVDVRALGEQQVAALLERVGLLRARDRP